MSKSLDNYIGVDDSPKDIFGKIMSISDVMMFRYWELLTDITPAQLAQKKKDIEAGALHPKKFKEELAYFFVKRFYGETVAKNAYEEFQRIFSKGGLPDEIPEKKYPQGEVWVCKLLADTEMVTSSSEARRMIQGMAVEIDGSKITDVQLKMNLKPGSELLIKVGKKKFTKVLVQN